MAQLTLWFQPIQHFFGASGLNVAGAKAYFYLAGTTTAVSVYTDVSGTIPFTQPVVADSNGIFAEVFLTPGTAYKVDVQTSAGVSLPGYPADNQLAIPASAATVDQTETAGEALTAGQAVYLSDGQGGKIAGQLYKADSANTYSSTTPLVGLVPSSIASGASGTFRIGGLVTGLAGLTVGADYYVGTAGALTTTVPANGRWVGRADSTTTLIISPNPPLNLFSSPTLTSPTINTSIVSSLLSGIYQGRLTLTTGLPVTTADVTAATNVYLTPWNGNGIALYDGAAKWTVLNFNEIAFPLGTLINAQGYDLFAYNNAGVVALESAEWANAVATMTIAAPAVVTWTGHGMVTGNSITFSTAGALPTGVVAGTQYFITKIDANTFNLSTSAQNVDAATFITTSGSQSGVHTGHHPQARQTAVVLQNGVLVKTGATTRRYLGSFFTTAATTTEDSLLNRYLFNTPQAGVLRRMVRVEATASWTYTTATWRQANGAAANQLNFFTGYAADLIDFATLATVSNTGESAEMATAVGLDSRTAPPTGWPYGNVQSTPYALAPGSLKTIPGLGLHSAVWIEWSAAVGTTTWYGVLSTGAGQILSGISGTVKA